MTQLPQGVIPEWTVGDRLRKARVERTGLNTRDFAELIGVSQKTVTDAEGDKRGPRKILLNAWAMATGVPAEWLTTGRIPFAPTPDPSGGESGDKLAALTDAKRRRTSGGSHTIGLRDLAA